MIVFAYKEHGEVVNAKFRGQGKRFWQSKDGKQTFWNFDALLDPSLRGENPARLVICEGEMDALTGIECGFPLTVSVPSGAPSRPSEGDIDPETDNKFRFLWNCWDELKDVREIVVAVDNDEPGKVLGNELVRRLGVDRCYFVECPDDCKDLNDVLLRHGKSGVEQAINEAKPYPIKGLYRLADFPDLPRPQTYSTGWRWLDEYLRVWLGSLVLVTGIPGHGKTTFVSALVLNVALENDWTVCFASFELVPAPFHRDVIRQYLKRKPASEQNQRETVDADAWINENVVFIAQSPKDEEQEFDLDQILDLAAIAATRDGIKVFVLDPWNEVEHRRARDESETDYIGRAIRALRRFARRFGVIVIIVAHPTKMGGGSSQISKPSLYDVSGSANWFNKCDARVVVWRKDISSSEVEICVKKVRFREAGKPGAVRLQFHEASGRFSEMDTLEAA